MKSIRFLFAISMTTVLSACVVDLGEGLEKKDVPNQVGPQETSPQVPENPKSSSPEVSTQAPGTLTADPRTVTINKDSAITSKYLNIIKETNLDTNIAFEAPAEGRSNAVKYFFSLRCRHQLKKLAAADKTDNLYTYDMVAEICDTEDSENILIPGQYLSRLIVRNSFFSRKYQRDTRVRIDKDFKVVAFYNRTSFDDEQTSMTSKALLPNNRLASARQENQVRTEMLEERGGLFSYTKIFDLGNRYQAPSIVHHLKYRLDEKTQLRIQQKVVQPTYDNLLFTVVKKPGFALCTIEVVEKEVTETDKKETVLYRDYIDAVCF